MDKIRESRDRALNSPIIVALLLMPFFESPMLREVYPLIEQTFDILKLAVMLCAGVMFLSRPKASLVTVLIGAYMTVLLLSTAIHGGNTIFIIKRSASIAAVCILLEQGMATDVKALVKGLALLLGVLCIVNLLTVILFPEGAYDKERYFLGLDNSHSFYILPALAVVIICLLDRRYVFQILALVVLTSSIYIRWVGSGVVAITAFVALFLLYGVKKSYKLLNIWVYYAIIAVLFVMFVLFHCQEYFSFLIEGVLKKSLTFSFRTSLWDKALAAIVQKPILGYGWLEKFQPLGNRGCHNYILQTLLDTGAIGLSVNIALLVAVACKLMKKRECAVGYVLSASFFSFLLVLLVESLGLPEPFYVLCVLACRVEDIIAAFEGPGAAAVET